MLLAELEVFHSRPIAPTRRLAIGVSVLPTAPAPGFGGILLGGIVAAFSPEVDPDLLEDLLPLMHAIEGGARIPQPRLRFRLQEDRVGLSKVRHRLIGTGEELRFEIGSSPSPEPNILAAVYAAGRLPAEDRPKVFAGLRRALWWRNELGPELVDALSDRQGTIGWSTLGGTDPVLWALGVLGLAPEANHPDEVQARFRSLLREAHPDHGGDAGDAADRITELTEARRILLVS